MTCRITPGARQARSSAIIITLGMCLLKLSNPRPSRSREAAQLHLPPPLASAPNIFLEPAYVGSGLDGNHCCLASCLPRSHWAFPACHWALVLDLGSTTLVASFSNSGLLSPVVMVVACVGQRPLRRFHLDRRANLFSFSSLSFIRLEAVRPRHWRRDGVPKRCRARPLICIKPVGVLSQRLGVPFHQTVIHQCPLTQRP
jgi:hypothetical protein